MLTSRSTRSVRHTLRVMLAMLLLLALVPQVALAPPASQTLYVDIDAGDDTHGTGTEGDPYQTITRAMDVIGTGTIYVAPGTYGHADEAFPIAVKPGVTVIGTEGADDTIIDAGGVAGVFHIINSSPNTGLQGLTLTGANDSTGALFIQRTDAAPDAIGSPRIVGCDIRDNDSPGQTAAGCLIEGGATKIAAPIFIDCDFTDNTAAVGGAVNAFGETAPLFTRCTFVNNESASTGGAFYVYTGAGDSCVLTLSDCEVRGNSAINGGGVCFYPSDGELSIDGGSFRGNTASSSGGGIELTGSDLTVEGVEFSGNSSSIGGGFHVCGGTGTVDVSDVAFFDNASNVMAIHAGLVTLAHVSVFENTGQGAEYSGGTLNVYNSVFWGNSGDDFSSAPMYIQKSCVEQGSIAGLGVIHDDPEMIDPEYGDYRLASGSPCIDTGGSTNSDSDDIEGNTRPVDGDGNGVAIQDMGCWERPLADVDRQAGSDRYDTACKMARDAFEYATTAILASGENFPDALSAAGLAGAHEGPLLLTRKGSVPPAVSDTLSDLGVQDVVIVGGEGAVSAAVATELDTDGYTVTRIAGATRYDTSAKVALAMEEVLSSRFDTTAFFARGDMFPDALAVAPLAYFGKHPVMLVRPGSVPTEIHAAIDTLGIQEGYVCGGVGAVSAETQSGLDALLVANGGAATERWAGDNRYGTAVTIAAEGVGAGFTSWDYVGLATGTNFPDALAGGMLGGANQGVVLLTAKDTLPWPTEAALYGNRDLIDTCEIYGGVGAVADSVKTAVDAALDW